MRFRNKRFVSDTWLFLFVYLLGYGP